MKYDFDSVVDRRTTNSYKWDIADNELPMWVADMDFRTAPEITAALKERVEHGIFGYTTISDEWYQSYINWWKNRHGIEYQKEQIIFSTGVIPTISSCIRKLTTPAENVLIMTPVYNIFYNCIQNNGRNVLECPLEYNSGEYSINWTSLEEKLADPQTTLMLLCNPHNPIGKVWDKETLARIGELANHIRKSTGLYLSNGVQFGNGEQFLRMNIACPKTVLADGLNRLKKAVKLL